MNQVDSAEIRKREPRRQLWSLWSGAIGFAAGTLIVFTPLYLHALEDWDLADKTTFFPKEFGSIACFYGLLWLVGGAVGAHLALLAVGTLRHFKAKQK